MPATPKVFYLGSFRFPDGDAAAARVLGIGKALREAGARVIFGGWEKAGRQQDRQPDGSYRFQDFQYVSQGDLRHARLTPPQRLMGLMLAGRKTLRWIGSQTVRSGDVVIAYHGGPYFLSRLSRWCKQRGVRLILDCTEWYSPRQLPGSKLSPAWWGEEMAMRLVNPAVGRLMVVSSFLEQYYTARGCAVLRVPPLIDLRDRKWTVADRPDADFPPLRLAYAGTPGRKDLLLNIFRGLTLLKSDGIDVRLNLIGPTQASVMAVIPESRPLLHQLADSVVFHGQIPQSDVPSRLRESHFTVLLRPDERYAHAGFPTKVVESLSAGLPVIANPTSDLASCIRDGKDGILLENHSPASLAGGLRRLIALGPREWRIMGATARARAEELFDYRVHAERIARFTFGSGVSETSSA
jgi:glycosyltransferase involved in cell wall biosynthesis